MELCGFASASAKNRRPDRTGYSSRGQVLGREERWPGAAVNQALDGEWPTETQGATGDGDKVFRRAMRIRLAAQDALVKKDSQATWARALNSLPFPMQREWTPGAQVLVWRRQAAANRYGTGGGQRRHARMASRWYGPGCVHGREATSAGVPRAYWVAFNGTLFLVAPEHPRAASQEPAGRFRRGPLELQRKARGPQELQRKAPFQHFPLGDLRDAEAATPQVASPIWAALRHGSEEPVIMPMEQDAADVVTTVASKHRNIRHRDDEKPSRPDAGDVDDALALINKVLRKGTKGEASNGADLDQWETHSRTGATRIVPSQEAKTVDPSRILCLPPRFVRTNRNEKHVLLELKARSRLVAPCHVVPDGETRTDAPVTPQQRLYISLSLLANHRWRIGSFDAKDGSLCDVLVVHVDDGLWAKTGVVYESARNKLRALATIGKEERAEFDFLGRQIYIPATRRQTPEDSLTGDEISQNLSLVQPLAWPVRTTLVRHTPNVSDLQQKTSRAVSTETSDIVTTATPKAEISDVVTTVAGPVRENFVRRELVKAIEEGEGLTFRPMKGYRPETKAIAAAPDACLSNKAGKSQQGYKLFAARTDAFSGESEVHFMDRSIWAAESSAASKCFDRAVLPPVIIAEFLPDSKAIGARWPDLQRVPMLSLSDCRSMVERTQKTGAADDEDAERFRGGPLELQRKARGPQELQRKAPFRHVPQRTVADCLAKQRTLDDELELIKNLLRNWRVNRRLSDDDEERVPSAEQSDSEDEEFSNLRQLQEKSQDKGVVALSKHIGVGLQTRKVRHATTLHATVAFSPRMQARSQRRFFAVTLLPRGNGIPQPFPQPSSGKVSASTPRVRPSASGGPPSPAGGRGQ